MLIINKIINIEALNYAYNFKMYLKYNYILIYLNYIFHF